MRHWIPAALAMATLALSGCAGSVTGPAIEQNLTGRGPITFAMGSNDADKLAPAITAWNETHPDEPVTLHELPEEADAQRETLVQSLQAGSGDYDVMALDVTWTAEFAANRWLQPLTGEMAIDTGPLLPAPVASASYRGTLYAAPQNTNAQLLYYRTDIVREAPKRWEQMLGHCPAAKAAGTDCLIMQLKNYEGLTVQVAQAIGSWGGSIVSEDGLSPELSTPEADTGYKALLSAYLDGEIPARANGFTEEETNLAFLAGEAAFAYNWPYMHDTAKTEPTSKVSDRFAVTAIPGPHGTGSSTLGGYNNGINVNSEHKATAHEFISYLQGEQVQRSFAEQSFPPVRASIYDDRELIAEHSYLPALKTAIEHAEPRPVSPFYAAISKAIHDNTSEALAGRKTAGQALDDITAAMNAAMNAATGTRS